MSDYVVEVIEYAGDKIIRQFGPMPERQAYRVDDGLQHNLDHERFYTRVVPASEARANRIGDP